MPIAAAIIPAAVAGLSAGLGAAIAGITIGALTVLQTALLIGVGTFILNLAGTLLTSSGRSKGFDLPDFGGFAQSAQSRTQMIRTAVSVQRLIVGEVMVSGYLTFLEQTNNNKRHHYIITVANHEIEGMGTIEVNDTPIYEDEIGEDGWVNAGPYDGLLRFKKHLGAADQVADPDLLDAIDYLDSNFRGRGVAYLYVTLEYDRRDFPNGLPNFKILARGARLYDPRTAATAWGANAWLATRWYLQEGRIGLEYENDSIDDEVGDASASISDEFADTRNIPQDVAEVDTDDDALDLVGEFLLCERGDRVHFTTTDTLPSGLSISTNYYVIPVRYKARDDDDDEEFDVLVRVKLATTYAGAMAGTANVSFADAGTGTHTMVKNGEPRYTAHGVIESDRKPADILKDLYSAAGALVVYSGGSWKFYAAAWSEPSIGFDEDDFTGPLEIATQIPERERATGVHGIYVSSQQRYQPTDYPVYLDLTLEAEDGGRRSLRELNLPFTNRSNTAQRLAAIDLHRLRQQRTISCTVGLTGLQVAAGEAVTLSLAHRDYAGLKCQVMSWEFETKEDEEGHPLLGIRLGLRETSSAVYDFDAETEENATAPAKTIKGSDALTVDPPGAPQVSESLYKTRTGAGIKTQVDLAWLPSTDGFLDFYRVQYQAVGATEWTDVGETGQTAAMIRDMAAGTYVFSVQAINTIGRPSDRVTTTKTVAGLSAAPGTPQNVTIQAIGGFALLQWDMTADIDVEEGGTVEFKHSAVFVGATWSAAPTIGKPVSGKLTSAVLPLVAGTYMVKFRDSTGNPSATEASITSKQATAIAYSPLATVQEETAFAGTHTNTVVIDGQLKLEGGELIDDWGLIDDVVAWDTEGGVVAAGTYGFATGTDLGSVKRVRLTKVLDVLINNTADLIDARTAFVDTWPSFDGTTGDEADIAIEVRHTDDDPAGTPTWSEWKTLDSAEIVARGLEYRAQLTSADPLFNMLVDGLGIQIDEVA